ncbi:MAG: hypothetical protein GXP62_19280 [Oligoflexia bacterium]|nr:hypothetical protein [Oligoflexia bacterium]
MPILAVLLWGLTAVGCHLGLPPLALPPGGVTVTRVDVAAVEAGLGDDLRSALTAALARRGLGGGQTALELRVLDASSSAVAASSNRRVHRAHLSVAIQLLGVAPRSVVLSAERSYIVDTEHGLASAQARSAAFADLAWQLADDAALWLSLAPTEHP